MKKVNRADVSNPDIKISQIEHFYKYVPKDKDGNKRSSAVPMVRIKGDFYGGGFNLSKNKAQAIVSNIEEIEKFARGDFDKQILELQEDEIILPDNS